MFKKPDNSNSFTHNFVDTFYKVKETPHLANTVSDTKNAKTFEQTFYSMLEESKPKKSVKPKPLSKSSKKNKLKYRNDDLKSELAAELKEHEKQAAKELAMAEAMADAKQMAEIAAQEALESEMADPIVDNIFTVDAFPGTGKTTSAIEYALGLAAKGKLIVIAQPTLVLMRQTYGNINTRLKDRDLKSKVKVIKVDSDDKIDVGVIKRVTDYVKSINKESTKGFGVILLISHSAMMGVSLWPQSNKWELILDEMPSAHQGHELSITSNDEGFYKSFIAVQNEEYPQFNKLFVKNSSDMRQFAYGPYCTRDVAKVFYSKSYDNYVSAVEWDSIDYSRVPKCRTVQEANDLIANPIALGKVNVHFTMRPNVIRRFGKVTIMGHQCNANLLLAVLGVTDPKDNTEISQHLRQKGTYEHVTVKYMSERNNSKYFVGKEVKNTHHDVYQEFEDAAKREMASLNQPYLVVTNKDRVFSDPLGTSIPVINHGMNEWQSYHNMVYLATMNSNKSTRDVLSVFGADAVTRHSKDIYEHRVFQAIMRLSIRNPESKEPATVIVFDKRAADHIASELPGCKVEQMANAPVISSVAKWISDSARVSAHNRSKTEAKHFEEIHGVKPQATILASVRDTLGVNEDFNTADQFIALLEDAHTTNNPQSKEDNLLYSPAKFTGGRGEQNIDFMHGVVLDCDDTNLSAKEFMNQMPNIKMAIYNTINSVNGNRWHAYIPTKQAFSAKAYKTVVKNLLSGTGMEKHFDVNSMKAAQIFYAPCRALAGDDHSFFMVVAAPELDISKWLNDAKIEAVALKDLEDSEALLESDAVVDLQEEKLINPTADEVQQAVRRATELYKTRVPGTGNSARMALGRRLMNAGLSFDEVKHNLVLTLEPCYRIAVKDILKTLEQ